MKCHKRSEDFTLGVEQLDSATWLQKSQLWLDLLLNWNSIEYDSIWLDHRICQLDSRNFQLVPPLPHIVHDGEIYATWKLSYVNCHIHINSREAFGLSQDSNASLYRLVHSRKLNIVQGLDWTNAIKDYFPSQISIIYIIAVIFCPETLLGRNWDLSFMPLFLTE